MLDAPRSRIDQRVKRRLDLCQAFAIPTLLVAADYAGKVDGTALQRAVVSLKQAAQWAAAFNVRLALEPRAPPAFAATTRSGTPEARPIAGGLLPAMPRGPGRSPR